MSQNHSHSRYSNASAGFDDGLAGSGAAAKEGFFSPRSVICRIHREALVMLGGGRAILLQLAHPLVTAGVADYSNFQSEILVRLYWTVLFMHNLIFENRLKARKALQHFHAMHDRIRGRLPEDAGSFRAGTPYSGSDPNLKLWVHATFIDTTLLVYEQFVTRLTPEERRSYYGDTLTLASLMDIPVEILPQTLDDFRQYVKEMLESDTITVTETARHLAGNVLHPRVGFIPATSAGLLRFVTAGLLPARLRREFGLKWNRRRQIVLNNLGRSSKLLRPFVPRWIWQAPLLEGRLSRAWLWGTGVPGTNR